MVKKTAKKKAKKKVTTKKVVAKKKALTPLDKLEERLFKIEDMIESTVRRLTPQLGSAFGEILELIIGDFDDKRVSGKCDRCGEKVNAKGECRNRQCNRYKSRYVYKKYM